jgi:hypothetical protein
MYQVIFKNYRRNLMKFFNKLSVISLIVLMFSFMNAASADYCGDYDRYREVDQCEDNDKGNQTNDTKAAFCNRSFERDGSGDQAGKGQKCKWTKSKGAWTCKDTGGGCGITVHNGGGGY